MDRVRKKRGQTRVMPRGTASTLGGGWLGDRAGSMTAVVASLGILFRSGAAGEAALLQCEAV